MTTSVIFEEQIEIPFVRSLAEFRTWARSDNFPDRGRIDYLAGRIEVDMSPEDLFSHGTLKIELARVLGNLVKTGEAGHLFSDSTRVSSPDADLSAEPDIVYLSEESLETGRVRMVPKSSEEPDRYVELEGGVDLVVEIVSDHSVTKDTRRLPAAYFRAHVREFWLIDARGEDLFFRIHHPGATGYEPAPSDPDGFQPSKVLGRCFRLTRRRNRQGRWLFDLDERL